MSYEKVKKIKCNLVHKTTVLKYKTEHMYFYDYSNYRNKEKKFKPVNENGYRKKLNIETGETRNYTHKEVEESLRVSKKRTLTNISNLLDCNHFNYFITLTFDPARIDRSNEDAVSEKLCQWLKYAHKRFKDFKYIFVIEKHKSENNYETAELHFHGLISGIPIGRTGLNLSYSGKVCCSWANRKNKIASEEYYERTKHLHELKDLDGQKVYNVNSWLWGFSTLTEVFDEERCASYLKKYLTKALCCKALFKKRFYYSRNLNKPVCWSEILDTFSDPLDLSNTLFMDNEQLLYDELYDYKKYNKFYNVMRYKVSNSKEELICDILTASHKQEEWYDDVHSYQEKFNKTKEELIQDYVSNNTIKKLIDEGEI